MRFRAPFATWLLLSSLLTASTYAQQFDRSSRYGGSSISGTVRGGDGSLLAGVAVELRHIPSGYGALTTYTQSNGSFALYNIPPGHYEVVARDNLTEVREPVSVGAMDANVDLRFPRTAEPTAGSNSSVSVAQLKVPEKARNTFRKAQEAFAKSNYPEAQKQVDKALAIYPNFAEAVTLRGLLLMHDKNFAESQKAFESAIEYDPNYSVAYLALGTLFNSMGQYDNATRPLERSVSMSPSSWQGYFEMARSYLGKGMYEKALQLANRAQTLAPSNFAAIHLLKAYAMLPQKLYKDAVQELHAFLSRGPNNPGAEQAQKLLAQAEAAELASEHPGQ